MEFRHNKAVTCADGFTMSVQANEAAYCRPRQDHAERYELVEIGYPSDIEELIIHYAETPARATATVYPYVPVSVVSLIIAKHGGMIDGELPTGIPILKSQET